MKFTEFLYKYDSQEVDVDGSYGGQCMDLMHQFVSEYLEVDSSQLRASTAYNSYLAYSGNDFEKIPYKQGLELKTADIVYWDQGVGYAGHVAIYIDGTKNHFISFDQNWPTGSKCHQQNHDYNNVIGVLRSKKLMELEKKVQELQQYAVFKDAMLYQLEGVGSLHLINEEKGLRYDYADEPLAARVGAKMAIGTIDKKTLKTYEKVETQAEAS